MIRPLPKFVVVLPIEDEGKTSKGVYLPDSSKDKPSRGTVINCGEFSALQSKVVVYKKYSNQEVTEDGKTYLLVPYEDLMAIIE